MLTYRHGGMTYLLIQYFHPVLQYEYTCTSIGTSVLERLSYSMNGTGTSGQFNVEFTCTLELLEDEFGIDISFLLIGGSMLLYPELCLESMLPVRGSLPIPTPILLAESQLGTRQADSAGQGQAQDQESSLLRKLYVL